MPQQFIARERFDFSNGDFIYMIGSTVLRGKILEKRDGTEKTAATRISIREDRAGSTPAFFWVPSWQIQKALNESRQMLNNVPILEGF